MDSGLVLRAPCKINWSLHVIGKRPDGYHDILSLMQCVDIYDTLTFIRSDAIELVCDMDLPIESNLVVKAARALCEQTGKAMGVKIILKKEIPSGAGLGGGSSDAACALKGLNALWATGLDKKELIAIGARLGSDVPFFFECPAAVVEGRGEMLTALDMAAGYTLLLIKPDISISTRWAYEELDIGLSGRIGPELTNNTDKINNIKLIYDALNNRETGILKSALHNDLENIVRERFPVISSVKERLLEEGASVALMSGSGSVVFGVFDTREAAVEASYAFSSYWCRVADTLTGDN